MKEIHYIWKHKLLLVFIILAGAASLPFFIFDGHYGCNANSCGLFIKDMGDGLWFDTVSAVAFKSIPFQMPNIPNHQLGGYHYLPNLISYLIHIITRLPFYSIRLHIFPIVYFVLTTILCVRVARKIHNDIRFVLLFCLFFMLGTPLRIVSAIINKDMGELWANFMINTFDATNILNSPHTAFSYIIILALINNLLESSTNVRNSIIRAGLLFLLFGTKFYTAFAGTVILITYSVARLLNDKKNRSHAYFLVVIGFVIGLSYLLFYRSPIHSDKPVFTWAPFALAHHIIENPGRFFYSQTFTLQRYYLQSLHIFSPRLLAIETISSVLFVVFYSGARIIGIIYPLVNKEFKNNITIISIYSAIIPLIIIPVLFIQRGIWFDTAQFLVTASYLLSFPSALLIYNAVKTRNKLLSAIIVSCIAVLFAQDVSIGKMLVSKYNPLIPQGELTALNVLKNAPDGIVFYPITRGGSPYVGAFSEKPSFLNYIHVLDNVGISYKRNLDIVQNADIEDLAKSRVTYLYIPKSYPTDEWKYFGLLNSNVKKSNKYTQYYENKDATIYKLRK